MNEQHEHEEKEYWETDDPNADVYVEDEKDKGKMTCPGCFTLNPPMNHFCEQCGKPLTGIACSDPYAQIFSSAHAYRTATEKIDGQGNKTVLIGMWLIFAPTALAAIYGLFHMLKSVIVGIDQLVVRGGYLTEAREVQPLTADFIFQFVVLVGYIAFCGWLLAKVTKAQTSKDDTPSEEEKV
ncbi:zinc ribbon domain-containing protein [Planctomycetota bacterium]|nr:zinc ribbon domain-containing protein [Planctomycetota bacterium]